MKAVGASQPRYDGRAHVSGRTVYADDVRPAGLLHARALEFCGAPFNGSAGLGHASILSFTLPGAVPPICTRVTC